MPQLVTKDELMRDLDLGGDNPARIDPRVINRILDGAEGFVETYTHRRFSPEPVFAEDGTDTNDPVLKSFKVGRIGSQSTRNSIRVRIPDLREYETVSLDGNELTEGIEFVFDTFAGDEPFTHIKLVNWNAWVNPWTSLQAQSTLEITGRWGFSPTPSEIKSVVTYLAAREYRRRDAMYADAVDTGTGVFDFGVRGYNLTSEQQTLLDLYKVPQVAVV